MADTMVAVSTSKTASIYFIGLASTVVLATLYPFAWRAIPQILPLAQLARFDIAIPIRFPWAPFMAAGAYCLFGLGLLSGNQSAPPVAWPMTFTIFEALYVGSALLLGQTPRGPIAVNGVLIPILIELLLLALVWTIWLWARAEPSVHRRAVVTAVTAVYFTCIMIGFEPAIKAP